VRGAVVDLRSSGDAQQLLITKSETVITTNLNGLPKNFTVETDFDFSSGTKSYSPTVILQFGTLPSSPKLAASFQIDWERGTGTIRVSSQESLGGASFKLDPDRKLSLKLWLREGRLRVYLNNERLIDVNQVELPVIDGAWMVFRQVGAPIGLARFRVAESAPEVK
jgi:hypothetical protein